MAISMLELKRVFASVEAGYGKIVPVPTPAPHPMEQLKRRNEELALIRILRDETNSKAIHDRCIAIVGAAS